MLKKLKHIAVVQFIGLLIIFIFQSGLYSKEIDGRIIYATIRPNKIWAGSRFNIRLSIQNTGTKKWQTYGLKLDLYDRQKRRIDLPVELAYVTSAVPLPIQQVFSIDTAIAIPNIDSFFKEKLHTNVYYFIAKLYASDVIVTQSELLNKIPLDTGKLTKFEIFNPSLEKKNITVETLLVTSSSISVSIRNNGLVSIQNFPVDLLINGKFTERKTLGSETEEISSLSPGQQTIVVFNWMPQRQGEYTIKAVAIVDDNYFEDNYITRNITIHP